MEKSIWLTIKTKGWKYFSLKGQIANIVDFAGHIWSWSSVIVFIYSPLKCKTCMWPYENRHGP